MIRRTQRRPGVTLIEVLIATFILSIGLLAILALFPIGAVSMARAINQTRSADHAANSDAMFRYYWKQAWVDPNGGGVLPVDAAIQSSGEPMIGWLDSLQNPNAPYNIAVHNIPINTTQPSYAVLVDPVGYRTQSQASPGPGPVITNQNYVCGNSSLPRRTSLGAAMAETPPRSTVRLTTLLDDMSFDGNGEPSGASGQIERGGRYSVSWLIQRPKNNVPHEVRLTAMVFAGRSPTDTPATEQMFPGFASSYVPGVDPKPNSITFSLSNQPKPAVRKGSWVAFSIPCTPPNGVAYSTFDFYRISAVDDTVANQVTLELEEPLRTYEVTTFSPAVYNSTTFTLSGYVVIFDNLIEVFDRGIVSASSISGR